ncbi:MAG: helix-turn-helix transcriptional regulator [Rickettsiales bacterium]|nr:helix-turn-helix transcriptional regulator [Rickettsiales bacterium]
MKNEELQKYIGEKIREIRRNKNISQLNLAFSVEMSMNTISYIENGKISPKIDTLNKIANELDVDICEFFPHKDNGNYTREMEQFIAKLSACSNSTLAKCKRIIDIITE